MFSFKHQEVGKRTATILGKMWMCKMTKKYKNTQMTTSAFIHINKVNRVIAADSLFIYLVFGGYKQNYFLENCLG